jgi:hypothetical protein
MTSPLSWLPATHGPAREDAILDAIRAERHDPIRWTTITVSDRRHTIELDVPEDALSIEGVRVNVTARTAQQIADLLECLLPTPRLVMLMHQQATAPVYVAPRPPDATMATTATMIARSRDVDAAVAGRSGLVSQGAWKHWAIAPGATDKRAANYGWMRASAKPWQSLGLAHNLDHTDYSQCWQCPRRACRVDGRQADLADVLRDPELAPLVSWDGALKVTRQPGVELVAPKPLLPPFEIKPAMPVGQMPWIASRNFTNASRPRADLVVIHSTEGGRKKGAARAVAGWFGGKQAPKASSHYVVDDDEVIACVKEEDVAWAAPGANKTGIQIEVCGYAKYTAEEWLSGNLLQRVAGLVADICRRHQIPAEKIGPAELLAGRRGITGHVDASKAWKKSSHFDPGVHFPWPEFIEMVRAA